MIENSKRHAGLASRISADTWDLRAGQFDGRKYKRWFKRQSVRALRRRARLDIRQERD